MSKPQELEDYNSFQVLMLNEMENHYPLYGDSWKQMSNGKLFDRLKYKFHEFELTNNPSKLISLSNLCMLLYTKLKNNPPKTQSPEEMIFK